MNIRHINGLVETKKYLETKYNDNNLIEMILNVSSWINKITAVAMETTTNIFPYKEYTNIVLADSSHVIIFH